MPNRIIKESAFTSDKIAKLSDFEFRLWIGLITQADDAGYGDARPAIIKGRVFALRERVTNKDIDNALCALAAAGCVSLYKVGGKPYYAFPSWTQHQRIRDCKPRYPSPEDADSDISPQVAANCRELPRVAASCRELPPKSNPIQSESNPNLNPNPKGARKNALEEYAGEDENLLKALEEFAEMRKSIKKPLTDAAVTRLLARLDGFLAEERTAILNQSVDHCWQDIYPLKTAPVQRGKNVQAACDRNAPTDAEYDDMKALLGELRGARDDD